MAFQLIEARIGSRIASFVSRESYDLEKSSITIIVGKNGAGKSRLLRDLIESLVNRYRLQQGGKQQRKRGSAELTALKIRYSIDGVQHEIDGNGNASDPQAMLPKRIIATSVSPFDKFPLSDDPISINAQLHRPDRLYAYLGSKNRVGQLATGSQMSRVVDSLVLASRKSAPDLHGLNRVFDFLSYKPRLSVEFHLSGSHSDLIKIAEGDSESFARHLDERSLPLEYYGDRDIPYDRDILRIEMIRAANMLTAHLSHPRQRKLRIDLNFEHQQFSPQLIETYAAISMLRRSGLIRLSQFLLYRRDGAEIRLREASSGEQAIVLTLLGIASQITDNSMICIDEPELSLHPEWQSRFIELLTATFANFSGCHFLLATHSPQIISRVTTANCAVLTLDDWSTQPASEFAGRSADYQLANVFHAPGQRNEFLMRTTVSLMVEIGRGAPLTPAMIQEFAQIKMARRFLPNDDPVAQLIDALQSALHDRDEADRIQ